MISAFEKPKIALAGISEIGIILNSEVARMPLVLGNEFVQVLPKYISANIQGIDFVINSANTKSDSKLTGNGLIYTYKTEMLVSVVRTEVLAFLENYVGKEILVIETHKGTDRKRLIGTKDFPARMEVSEDTGTEVKGANIYKLTITSMQDVPARFFKKDIYRVFDNSFDLTFN